MQGAGGRVQGVGCGLKFGERANFALARIRLKFFPIEHTCKYLGVWVNWVHEALHDWIKNSEAVFTKNERRELRKKGQTKEEKNEFGTENTEKRKTSNEGLQIVEDG